MAGQSTTFTAITGSDIRDDSNLKAQQYLLDGNTVDGRLNIDPSARWIVGDNTVVAYTAFTNHTFMRGIIESNALTFVAAQTSGRVDFSSSGGGMVANDLTYIYAGGGLIFNHLENPRNVFTGFTRFIFDLLVGGEGFIQFANREYANIQLDIKTTNLGNIQIYPARSHINYSSFPAFTVRGSANEIYFRKGSQATSHGRIYDPVYEGKVNNIMTLRSEAGGANSQIEYFTLDVTAIRSDDIYISIIENGVQGFTGSATVSNTTIYEQNGTTALSYYNGRSVIPIKVRTIGTTASDSRDLASYRIRQKGKVQINSGDIVINNPVLVQEMIDDIGYDISIDGSTVTGVSVDKLTKIITVSENKTTQEIYNYISYYLSINLDVPFFASFNNGLDISDWDLTTTNGAIVTGTIFSATQDSSLIEAGGAVFTVYASEADRDARVNPIVSDTVNYSFLFSSLPANPVYLWVKSGATELPTTKTLVQGINEFDLGTAGVLNTLSNLIQYIPSKIYVDVTSSLNGTGTEVAPYNNIQDAIDNSPNLGTKTIVFMADTTIVQSLNDFKIEGTPRTSLVTLNSQVITNCTFSGLKITGVAGVGSSFNANKCTLIDVSNLNGTYTTAFIENNLIPASGGEVNMVNITSAEPADQRPTLDFTGVAGVSLVLREYRGGLNIVGMENALDLVTISGTECKYTIDATCTAGDLSIRGIGQLTDNSTGTNVDTTALNNPQQIGAAVSNIISNVDVPTSSRASQADITQVLADTNELQTNQGNWVTATSVNLNNNAITSSTVANNAFNNSSFTTGYFNSINSEVDTALNDYDAETKAEADARQALLISEHNQTQSDISNITFSDTAILAAIAALNDISVADVEGSNLAKEATLNAIAASIANIPTTDSVADLTPVLNAISGLNDVTPNEVRQAFNAVDFQDKNTELEIHNWLDSYTNKNNWQADVSNLSADVNVVQVNSVAVTSVDDFKAAPTDLTSVLTAITNLNDPTKEEIRDAILLVADSFKADVTPLALETTSQQILAQGSTLNNPIDLRDAIIAALNITTC